jgi:hypothetical protein
MPGVLGLVLEARETLTLLSAIEQGFAEVDRSGLSWGAKDGAIPLQMRSLPALQLAPALAGKLLLSTTFCLVARTQAEV